MDRVLLQFFEWYLPEDTCHWKRLAESAPALKQAGFTDIWMPPAYKGASGKADVGYGVYDLYDLGEFDQKGTVATKYGIREEYLNAIAALHREGLRAIGDIVLNHKMGADGCETLKAEAVAANDRERETGESEISAWTVFNFPGRRQKYSSFCWNHTHFDGVDWDDRRKRHEIFLLAGKDWDSEVDTENGNYDYLMGADLDMGNPEVVAELDRWGEWYVNTASLDGLRLDAVKHISFDFFTGWLSRLREKTGKELWAVGEYWSPDLQLLLHYQEKSGRVMSLFDVPLHFHFMQASSSNGNFDMSKIFENTLTAVQPEYAVTFVDNHDTQPGQALQSFVQPWFKPHAYAMILLRQAGTPCIFYGDYYGIPHDNIPSQQELLNVLLGLRQQILGTVQEDYLDDANIIGWVRRDEGDLNKCCVVILTDSCGGQKRMQAGRAYAGKKFRDALGRRQDLVGIGEDGWGDFPVDAGAVSVWVPVLG